MTDPLIGSTTAVFDITLSVALTEPVDVAWSTKDGTAIAGTDYEAANGVVTFLPGETSKQIQVTVYGQDVGANQPKNFYITLTPPSNAILNTPLVECIITVEDDQGTPITSLVVAQGKRGLKGDPGLSAYEQAVIMGYTGTIEDWMNDIANAALAADRAEDALVEVEANAAKAEAAASAAAFAGRIFQTPAAGVDPITGVPNGYFYNVRSPSNDAYIDEYQNVDGVPTATGKSYPSATAHIETTRVDDGSETQKVINDKSVRVFNSIADLLAYTPRGNGQVVRVKGYKKATNFALAKPYKGGDYFEYKSNATDVVNDGTVFKPNDNGGRWFRIPSGDFNASWFGAEGLGQTGDQQCISKAYEYLNSIGGGTLNLDDGIYLIDTVNYADEMPTAGVVGLQEQYAFPIYSNITVLGQSRENTIFKMADGIIYKDLNRANLGCALFADAHKGLHVKNFRLERFKVDMNGINNPVVNLPTTGLGGAQQAIFPVLYYFDYYYSKNITVDNIWVHQNSGMNSIFIGHKSTQSVISNCLFTDHSDYIDGNDLIKDHSTIYIAGLNNLVQNNMFVMGHDPVSTNERTKTSYISTAIEAHGVNTIVTGNIVDGYGAPFLAASTEWYNGDSILFANNKAYQAQIGFSYNSMNGQLRAQFIGNEVKLRKAKASTADNFLRYAHAAIESQGAMNSIVDRSAAYSEIYVLNNVFEQEEPADWNDTDKFINACHNVKEAKLFVSKGNTFKNFKGTALFVLEHRNWLEAQIVLNSNTYINCGQDKTYSLYRAAYMLKADPQASEAGFAYNLLDSVIASNETFIDCNYGVLVAKPNTLTAKTIDITGVKYLGSFIPPVLIASPIDMTAGHTINIEYETTGFVSAVQTLGDFQGVSGKLKMNKWSASNVDDYLLKNFEYVKTAYYPWNLRALSNSAPTATGQFGAFPNKDGDRIDLLTPVVNGYSSFVRFNGNWYGTGKIDATNIVT